MYAVFETNLGIISIPLLSIEILDTILRLFAEIRLVVGCEKLVPNFRTFNRYFLLTVISTSYVSYTQYSSHPSSIYSFLAADPDGGDGAAEQPPEDRAVPPAPARAARHGRQPHRLHDEAVPRGAQGDRRRQEDHRQIRHHRKGAGMHIYMGWYNRNRWHRI